MYFVFDVTGDIKTKRWRIDLITVSQIVSGYITGIAWCFGSAVGGASTQYAVDELTAATGLHFVPPTRDQTTQIRLGNNVSMIWRGGEVGFPIVINCVMWFWDLVLMRSQKQELIRWNMKVNIHFILDQVVIIRLENRAPKSGDRKAK